MGVRGCRWPSSADSSRIVSPYFTFMNSAPNSASAADTGKNFRMVQRVKIALFSVMDYPSLDTEPRNKFPDV